MTLTPGELGDSLARLVWESFSDYLEVGPLPPDAREEGNGDVMSALVPEELLILFLWVHTRACQQAFGGRVEPAVLKDALDAMHRAIFEDLEAHGTPREQLPLLEQRVSARYSEYYGAADGGAGTVGGVAARWVSGREKASPLLSAALAEAAMAAAGPLRDYLNEVVLIGGAA